MYKDLFENSVADIAGVSVKVKGQGCFIGNTAGISPWLTVEWKLFSVNI